MIKRICIIGIFLLFVLLMTACAVVKQDQSGAATSIASTFIAGQTQSAQLSVQTNTPEPQLTTEPQLTHEPEVTTEETTYPASKCMEIDVPSSMSGLPISFTVQECVDSITVLADGSMQVNFVWNFTKTDDGVFPDGQCLTKGSDYQNSNMYMTDDLGNQYDHSDVGMDIGLAVLCDDEESGTITDYFLFPPVDQNAQFLVFHDDDNGIQTDPIVILWNK